MFDASLRFEVRRKKPLHPNLKPEQRSFLKVQVFMKQSIKAVGLLSGGLDSMLAARIILDQGITVHGVSFVTPFFGAEKAQAAGNN